MARRDCAVVAPVLPAGPRSEWRVGARDPGTKPACVRIDMVTGLITHVSKDASPDWVRNTPWDVFATEGQWYYGKKRGPRGAGGAAVRRDPDVNDLLKLAFRAGFDLACTPAARSLRVPPQVWREPFGNLSKEQVQKKIADDLTAGERALIVVNVPASRHGDVLDAIGIARWVRLRAFTTTEYDWEQTP